MKSSLAEKPREEWSPEEKEEFIVEYLPLVRGIAQRIYSRLPAHLDLEDLVSAGILGLLDAMDKFDPKRKTRFRTYAEFRIRGAILDELRAQDWFPRSVREKINRLERTVQGLEKSLGREPSLEEIAQELGLELEQASYLLSRYGNMNLVSLEEVLNLDLVKEKEIEDWLSSPKSANPFEALLGKELRALILKELENLPEQERQVLGWYYLENLSLKEIAEIMGVTESRVSQIHTQARLRLKKRINSQIASAPGKIIPFPAKDRASKTDSLRPQKKREKLPTDKNLSASKKRK